MRHVVALMTVILIWIVSNRAECAVLNACIVKDRKLLQPIEGGGVTVLQGFEKKNCAVRIVSPVVRDEDKPFATSSNYIVIWAESATGSPERIDESPINEINITTGNTPFRVDLPLIRPESTYTYFSLSGLKDTPHGTPAIIRFSYKTTDAGGTRLDYSYSGAFRARTTLVPYGIAGSESGFWIPAALFASDLQPTDTGIPFAGIPIGLAYGRKIYLYDEFYLGPSAMINWLIAPGKNVEGESDDTINLQAGTLGLLIDVSNYVYLGYAYGVDFRKKSEDPGHLLVFGVAPGLFQLLQSKPQ